MATDTLQRPAETDETDTGSGDGKDRLGRALDIAGICAAVVLGVILFDVFSGGRVTRWAQARRGGPGKSGPCEGCGGDGAPDDD